MNLTATFDWERPARASQVFCIAVGALLGLGWFFYNLSLPALNRGRVCCDSVNYVELAQSWKSPAQIFKHAGERTVGYPAFLWLHKAVVGWTGADWITSSLVTALLLHFISTIFLFRAALNVWPLVPTWTLIFLLANPALTSAAAVPLSDSLAASLVQFIFGLLMISPEKPVFRRGLALGVLMGVAILVRPSLQIPLLAFACVFVVGQLRVAAIALPVALLVLTPWLVVGKAKFGHYALSDPGFSRWAVASSFNLGNFSARTYTSFVPDTRLESVKDTELSGTLEGKCGLAPVVASTSDILHCIQRHPLHLLWFFPKKLIGAFDNYALNTYAVDITPPNLRSLNRIFALPSFLGVFALLLFFLSQLFRGRPHRWLAPLLALGIVLATMLLHIESRYVYPVLTLSLLAFAEWMQLRGPRVKYVAVVLLAAAFLTQVYRWDGAVEFFHT